MLALFSTAALGLSIGSTSLSTPSTLSRTPAVTMAGGKIASKNVWVPITEMPAPGEIVSGYKYNVEVAVVNTGGSLYGFINKMPPTGQPVTFATVEDKCLVEPVTKTKFSLQTGKVVGTFCPGGIGKLFGLLVPEQDMDTVKVRKTGGKVEALINVNAKAQFEQKYWRGVLDAQGKVDGGYY
mmetsp:Transcript_6314/g.13997  ORF Transcript_6314/g.13997 Transcript_6314/m.13997 type:complete len:182 (+) Transcript_6314:1386-1931(+)